MAQRKRKGQPKGRVQLPPIRQKETEDTQDEETQEETREVARANNAIPAQSSHPAKTTGAATAKPDPLSDEAQGTDTSCLYSVQCAGGGEEGQEAL